MSNTSQKQEIDCPGCYADIRPVLVQQLTTIKERVENSEFPKHYGESGIAYQNGYDDGLLEALSIISEYLPEEESK